MDYKIFVDRGIGPQLIAECIDYSAAVDFAAVYAYNHSMGWMWSNKSLRDIIIRPGFTNGKPRLRGGRV